DMPAYRHQLATVHNQFAVLLRELGKRAEAEAEFREALATAEKLAADLPGVADYCEGLGQIHDNLANLLPKGAEQEAEVHHRRAIALRQDLADEFPRLPDTRQGLASALTNFSVFLDRLGKTQESLVEARRALALRKQLAADFPAIPDYVRRLAMCH